MTDDVTTYLRNLTDYEIMKLLHEARPDKYPNPDTDPDLQADGAERIDGDGNETTFEKRLRELDEKAVAAVLNAAEQGDAETLRWLDSCGRTVDDLREKLRSVQRGPAQPAGWSGKDWRDGARYFANRTDEQAVKYISDMPRAVLAILRAAAAPSDH